MFLSATGDSPLLKEMSVTIGIRFLGWASTVNYRTGQSPRECCFGQTIGGGGQGLKQYLQQFACLTAKHYVIACVIFSVSLCENIFCKVCNEGMRIFANNLQL